MIPHDTILYLACHSDSSRYTSLTATYSKNFVTPQTATSRQPAKTSPLTSIVSQPQIVSTVSLLLESPHNNYPISFLLQFHFVYDIGLSNAIRDTCLLLWHQPNMIIYHYLFELKFAQRHFFAYVKWEVWRYHNAICY